MDDSSISDASKDGSSPFRSPTFDRDAQIHVSGTAGSASISPSYRDVVVASREGLHIIDLDFPLAPPRHLAHYSPWEVADVQWSPFKAREYWVVSTSNQKALVWNLAIRSASSAIQYTLHAHSRAITDINFSAHYPDVLATCAVDSYVHCWDLRDVRRPDKPVMTFADWNAGATQVKWNRQDPNILASSHDRFLRIWDRRKGASPLRSIEAHRTKIYGIDWSRTGQTTLITCSLDKTIKCWDYANDNEEPEQVIRTTYPVWRARHTPFGSGILAMPQRGNNDLHLYDMRTQDDPAQQYTAPVHSFKGHDDQVKEFLWRSRGGVEDGLDERDFQLISWGMDRDLHLHRIESRHLRSVGYQRGQKADSKLNLTRQGAEYKTYRDETKIIPPDSQQHDDQPQGLGALPSPAGMSKAPLLFGTLSHDRGFALSSNGMLARKGNKNADPVKWMIGVKMGRKRALTIDPFHPRPSVSRTSISSGSPQDEHEKLSDEITSVARKFKKVEFEEVEVQRGIVTVGLNGPWGPNDKPVFLRVTLKFPEGYPRTVTALFTLERATSAIDDRVMDKLNRDLDALLEYHGQRRTGCLDSVVTYLLGERSLEESMFEPDLEVDSLVLDTGHAGDSSSDEEEVGAAAAGLENSGSGTLGQLSGRTPPPQPKACGAYFASNGKLVCFFPPKNSKPKIDLEASEMMERSTKVPRHLESLGRWHEPSPASKGRTIFSGDGADSESSSSSGSWDTSSSSSGSSESDDVARLPDRFNPPAIWRAAPFRFQKAASRSSGGLAKAFLYSKSKSVITVHDLSDLLPSKKPLAVGYKLFGDGPEVCKHNSRIARDFKNMDAVRAWDICAILLHDQIPLETMEQPITKTSFLTVAQRNLLRGKSKDDGFKIKFDERRAVTQPMRTGHVRWGSHPLARTWLIPQLFEYFERIADVQMLAMLSCVLCEPPPAHKPTTSSNLNLNLAMALKAPACSLNYFADKEVAFNSAQEIRASKNTALFSSPALTASDVPADYFSRMPVTSLTVPTAGISWIEGLAPSPQMTPYSTSTTPPGILKPSTQLNGLTASLSSSPEVSSRPLRKTASHLTNALANWSRPFSTNNSTSPDDRHRMEVETSTSAPTTGITWGANTIISGSSTPSPEKQRRPPRRRSSAFPLDSGYNSSDDDEAFEIISSENAAVNKQRTAHGGSQPRMRVHLKNQDEFEDEAHPRLPLLDPAKSIQYAAYREMYAEQLSIWGLEQARAEVLKFNGLAAVRLDDEDEGLNLTLPNFAARVTESASALSGDNLRRPSANPSIRSNSTRFLPLTSASASPSSSQTLTLPTLARLNPAAKIFTPNSPSLGSVRSNATASISKHSGGLHTAEESLSIVSRSVAVPLCSVCWEPAIGLYLLRETGNEGEYRTVHAQCA